MGEEMKYYMLDGTVRENMTGIYTGSSVYSVRLQSCAAADVPSKLGRVVAERYCRPVPNVEDAYVEVRFAGWAQDSNDPCRWVAVLTQADPYTVSRAREEAIMETAK